MIPMIVLVKILKEVGFVEILGHEMVHYYQKLILKQNTAKHNKEFYSFKNKFKKLGLNLKRVYR